VKFQEVVVHSVENWEAEFAKNSQTSRPNGLSSCATHDLTVESNSIGTDQC